MDRTHQKTQQLIEYLQGSSNTLNEGVQTIYGDQFDDSDLDENQHEQIDGEIFCCDNCGWWCEVSDRGQEFCSDCEADDDSVENDDE